MRAYRRSLPYLIPLVLTLGICVILVKQVRLAAYHEHSANAFNAFTGDLESYQAIRKEWRPRILSNYLAGRLNNLIDELIPPNDPREVMLYLPSVWTIGWTFLICVLFISLFNIRSVIYILGLYVGISFGYLPGIGINRVYPWDLPALFVYSLFIGTLEKDKYRWLAAMIPVAILLKETAFLLALAFLFWPGAPRRKRLSYLVATVAFGVLVKGIVDLATGNPTPVWTMTTGSQPGDSRIDDNWLALLDLQAAHPVFINSGLFLALALLPVTSSRIWLLKAIAAAFSLGVFLFGVINEYRVWFELIPLSIYAIDLVYLRPPRAHGHAGKASGELPCL